jgi:hypothetical protein
MTDEQIESINNGLKEKENRRNLILKKAKNKFYLNQNLCFWLSLKLNFFYFLFLLIHY